MENKILVADFSSARVGDKVKCLSNGKGEIIKINTKGLHDFISVQFDSRSEIAMYSSYGLWFESTESTLFYDFPNQFPTEEHCKRPLPKIEVDDNVWIWNNGWDAAHFFQFDSNGELWTYKDGCTSWTSGLNSTECVMYWKTADEKYDSGNLEELKDER